MSDKPFVAHHGTLFTIAHERPGSAADAEKAFSYSEGTDRPSRDTVRLYQGRHTAGATGGDEAGNEETGAWPFRAPGS